MNTDNKSMNDSPYWNRVKELLKNKHMTQVDLCQKTGIIIGTMKGWQVNNRLPGSEESVQIAKTLDTTVEYLVTGEEPLLKDKSPELKAAIQSVLDSFN